MTDPAIAELLRWLMSMAAIALLMRRERRLYTVWKLMAAAALGSFGLAGHLFWIHVLLMREPLDPELAHFRRKTDPRSLRINRRFVADDAHLARCVAEVFRVTLYAR